MKSAAVSLAVVLAVTLLSADPAAAAGPFSKLGRGLTNTLTGWIEVPVTMHKESVTHDYMVGLSYGFPIGLVRGLTRTMVGIFDTITFFLPYPNDYEAIVEPEFVIESPLEEMRE